ncbi:serine/threonine protein kinase [Microbacterium sp. A1-JK]|uniref:serine/threonine protein kinase n=1 Tax=Microbacterium sp. A1-JK TaxID=3177516 RepID=UPI0038843F4C
MSDAGDGAMTDGLVAGRFRVLGLLGSGATASVYDALDTRDGGRVAVKVLHPHLAARPEMRSAFLREAERVAALSHPALCGVVGSGSDGIGAEGETWTAWQLAPGLTLGEQVRERGTLSARTAADVGARVLDGLAVLHAAGLVHRDISPSNIVVDVDSAGHLRDARIIDFGLVDEAGTTTRGGDVLRSEDGDGVVGNLQYAAPELLRGEGVGPSADLYQLAGVLYFALVGSPPFARDSSEATIRAHQSAAPPTVSVSVGGVPVAFDRVIVRAMLKDPATRFGSAGEMRDALSSAVASRSNTVAVPVDRTTRTRVFSPAVSPAIDAAQHASVEPEGRGGSPWLWGLGLVAVGLVVAVVVALSSGSQPTTARETPAPVVSSPAVTASPPAPTPVVQTPPPPVMAMVPSLEGMDADAATRALAAAGLAVGEIMSVDSVRPIGTVLASQPAVGTTLAAGGFVALTVASGANAVPDVVGAPEQSAMDAVVAAGFVPVVTRQSSSAPTGTVTAVQPAGSASLPLGTTVSLVVAAPLPAPSPTTPPVTPTPTPTRTPTPGATP